MAELSPPQRDALVLRIAEIFGVEVDPQVLAFETPKGVSVVIGPDRTIELSIDDQKKALAGEGFSGRGFTGIMVSAIAEAEADLVLAALKVAKSKRGRRAISGDREFFAKA